MPIICKTMVRRQGGCIEGRGILKKFFFKMSRLLILPIVLKVESLDGAERLETCYPLKKPIFQEFGDNVYSMTLFSTKNSIQFLIVKNSKVLVVSPCPFDGAMAKPLRNIFKSLAQSNHKISKSLSSSIKACGLSKVQFDCFYEWPFENL
jgi:hypothetical protein